MENATLGQELQTILTIIKWVVGVMAPIVTGLSWACYRLWQRNNTITDKHASDLSEQADKHAAELKECWRTSLDAFVEQGKVVERMTAKIEGGSNAGGP